MRDKIESLRAEARGLIEECSSLELLDTLRVRFLGRKGELTAMLRGLGMLPAEQRPLLGQAINSLKNDIRAKIDSRRIFLRQKQEKQEFAKGIVDVTLPGLPQIRGAKHPISLVMSRLTDIFTGLGFVVEEGPEAETDYYNFSALNFPPEHPAKDMQATLYITDELLMRTHTSPVQIRVMQRQKPPLRCIMPGRVYRCDSDVSHSPVFHQVEGLLVGEGVTFGELKGVLAFFAQKMFGAGTRMRFRPSFFPFTEPSAEIDISCVICSGKGCRVCKETGWVEILGAGMVHPAVFEAVGYDPERYIGYAFGMGVERIAMLKYRIDDIRLFFENDVRFLQQFK
ncbi:MAG: phenylalanine--tRNA ligase subunit alpha [Candidatus Aureabacteria bacterium]|nr:phenylalanine--tRNA ligase subunit alpha [Candidatus Auribacterota bacterium]